MCDGVSELHEERSHRPRAASLPLHLLTPLGGLGDNQSLHSVQASWESWLGPGSNCLTWMWQWRVGRVQECVPHIFTETSSLWHLLEAIKYFPPGNALKGSPLYGWWALHSGEGQARSQIIPMGTDGCEPWPFPSFIFFEDFWRSQGHKGEKTHTCPLHESSRSTVKEAGTAWSPEGCDEHRLGESP